MSLRVLDPAEEVVVRLKNSIEAALPGADVVVAPTQPGHFEIRVVADEFRGLPRVQQHQRVYAAIAPLMQGDSPWVHAVDRLETRTRGDD